MNGINSCGAPPFYRDRYEGRERPVHDANKEGEKIVMHCDERGKALIRSNLRSACCGGYNEFYQELTFCILKSQSIKEIFPNLEIFTLYKEMPWFLLSCVGYSKNYRCHIHPRELITLLVFWQALNVLSCVRRRFLYIDLKEESSFLFVYIRENGQMKRYDLNKKSQLFDQLSEEFKGRHILESLALGVGFILDHGPDIQIRYEKRESASLLIIPSAHYLERIFAIIKGSNPPSLNPVITGSNHVAPSNEQYNLRIDDFFRDDQTLEKRFFLSSSYVSNFLSPLVRRIQSPSNLVSIDRIMAGLSLNDNSSTRVSKRTRPDSFFYDDIFCEE